MKRMRKARVLITEACPRRCSYCCNKGPVIKGATILDSIGELPRGYDEIMITGGEPLAMPETTLVTTKYLRDTQPAARLYLYTAQVAEWQIMKWILNKIDGIHYTVHERATVDDIGMFARMQLVLTGYPRLSKRLFIHPTVEEPMLIWPRTWNRIELKPFLSDCPLPEGEELFIVRRGG